MPINVPALDKITRAIGYICVFWAWLERGIDELLVELIPLEKDHIGRALTGSMDMRDKIKVLRAAAFVRKLDDKWFAALTKLLDKIDNELRPLRNRFIHDAWFKPRGKLQRKTQQVKFKKPKAYALELSTEETTPVKMGEAWGLGKNILNAQIELAKLQVEYQNLVKFIDEEAEKQLKNKINAYIAEYFPSTDKSSPPSTRQASRDTRPKNAGSKPKRQQQS